MLAIYRAEHIPEAHLVRGMLEAAGIAAVVRGEHLCAARGGLPLTEETCPLVCIVLRGDWESAQRVLADYRRGRARDTGLIRWRCASCDEWLDGQFTDCWQCGHSRLTPYR